MSGGTSYIDIPEGERAASQEPWQPPAVPEFKVSVKTRHVCLIFAHGSSLTSDHFCPPPPCSLRTCPRMPSIFLCSQPFNFISLQEQFAVLRYLAAEKGLAFPVGWGVRQCLQALLPSFYKAKPPYVKQQAIIVLCCQINSFQYPRHITRPQNKSRQSFFFCSF